MDLRRWLSPEPLAEDPEYVLSEAYEGFATPTYAYAANNPLAFFDDDGLSRRRHIPRPGESPPPAPEDEPEPSGPCPPGFIIVPQPHYIGALGLRGPDDYVCVPAPDGVEPRDLPIAPPDACAAVHTKNKRPSNWNKHSKKKGPGAPERGDDKRRPPLQKPKNWKGPWPPKDD